MAKGGPNEKLVIFFHAGWGGGCGVLFGQADGGGGGWWFAEDYQRAG